MVGRMLVIGTFSMTLWTGIPRVKAAQSRASLIPPAINSTYTVRIPGSGEVTVHLFEQDGALCLHQTSATGAQLSESVPYRDVNYIVMEADSAAPKAMRYRGFEWQSSHCNPSYRGAGQCHRKLRVAAESVTLGCSLPWELARMAKAI